MKIHITVKASCLAARFDVLVWRGYYERVYSAKTFATAERHARRYAAENNIRYCAE